MNKEQASGIIKEIFEQSFDKNRFVSFTKNLLNHIETSTFSYHGVYISDAYRPYISRFERIGKFHDGENRIDILIVEIANNTSFERARTIQRNFIAGYLQGKHGSSTKKDAALVAFIAPNNDDWRFSLVRMDYRFKETETGKIKIEEEFTPARRWSFLVGANEKSHTAQSQLIDILANDEKPPTLSELETAFNIETVTKEFFLQYRDLFIRTKEALDNIVNNSPKIQEDFKNKAVNTVDFAKKLLGQIVFLYFLQKKGWFGVNRDADWGTGSKQFLRELFEKKHGDYTNFFNDILEPLFYQALRIDRSHDDDYYSHFKCKIPFLNGGLFDPIGNYDWVHTDILLPDHLFSNHNQTREGDIGNGILDIFDRYNFTVKEDEPMEKEVAIDPELLGKAYEKFNAIRPDNFEEYKEALKSGRRGAESRFNKQYGVYYTPREIVHYMCQQSLINYLATESKISKEDIETLIHIGEQTTENEARVLKKGKETTTYSYKLPENIRNNAVLIDRKLEEITICDPAVGSGAFPVGMMSEIVKTRNVLTPFINDHKRTPYEFKRHCIEHSLYGVDIDPGAVEIAKLRLWLSLIVDEDDIKNIKPLPNLDYKIVCGNSLLGYPYIPMGLDKVEELKEKFLNEVRPKEKESLKNRINETLYSLFKNTEQNLGYKVTMDFKINFSEVFRHKGGFDVVIANPPYGGFIDSQRKLLSKLYPHTTKQFKDIYKIFIELGLSRLCTHSSILCYITPNTLIRQPRYRDTRQFILNFTIIKIVNLGEKVFEQAVVPTCFFFVKKDIPKGNSVLFLDISYNNKFTSNLLLTAYAEKISQDYFKKNSDNVFALEQLAKSQTFLQDVVEFRDAGINYQRVNVGMEKKGKSDLGQRLLYEGKRESSNDIEFWKGGDIDKYYIAQKTNRFVRIKTVFHLRNNERVILNRDFFKQVPKLIWRQTASHLIATIDEYGIYFGRSIQSAVIKQDKQYLDYKYLCGVFNSAYLQCKYNEIVKEEGRVFPQVKWAKIKRLPIPDVQRDKQLPIITIVNKIFSITQTEDYRQNQAKQAKVKTYEKEIDQLVYKLYSLTPEEIAIVEGDENVTKC